MHYLEANPVANYKKGWSLAQNILAENIGQNVPACWQIIV